jgi:hypothetical protein
MVLRLVTIGILCVMTLGCGSTALELTELSPVRSSTMVTLRDVFRVTGRRAGGIPPNLEKVVILGVDSSYYALSLFEFEDLVILHLVVSNLGSTPRPIEPEKITLLDRDGFMFPPLEPHQAANIFTSSLRNSQSYQHKESPSLENRTRIRESDRGTYGARSNEFRNPIGEAAYQAAYDFENAIAKAMDQNRNKKYTQIAGIFYALGIIEETVVPAKMTYEGALYWLNRDPHQKPFRLMIYDRGEIDFEGVTE